MPLTLATITPGEPEIFAALQGEGPSAGKPCAFVRLSRCNLACEWCDTAYTWHFDGDSRPHRDGETYTRAANQVLLEEADVAARIAALRQPRLVITGGEPLLQEKALARMLEKLGDVRVEVETNGTVAPSAALAGRVAQWNVSPKLAHSGNAPDLALIPDRLAAWAADERAVFKFVVASPDDLTEITAIAETHGIAPGRIWLMPEGRDPASLRARLPWIEAACLAHGFCFTDRLHIHLHGDSRGT